MGGDRSVSLEIKQLFLKPRKKREKGGERIRRKKRRRKRRGRRKGEKERKKGEILKETKGKKNFFVLKIDV